MVAGHYWREDNIKSYRSRGARLKDEGFSLVSLLHSWFGQCSVPL